MDKPHRDRLARHRAGQAAAERLVESFNGRLRGECLNEEVFANLAEARAMIERWLLDYNHIRPHSRMAPHAAGDQLSTPGLS